MAKFHGVIGYAETVQTKPGVWTERITERHYTGELTRINRRLQSSDQLNDNVTLGHEISIIADPYANQHYSAVRYVEFMGAKWKISSVEVRYPRLILTVGGLYNA